MEIKLPFGLKNNKIIHIDDIAEEEKGKKCGCVCPDPSCRSPLIAAKGDKNQHHFRHVSDCECKGGLESAIHMAAKQVIMERKQISLPEYVEIVSDIDSKGREHAEKEIVVQDGIPIEFDSVKGEKELHGIRADILARKGKTPLIIEIFYRHKVEEQKREKIAKAKISAIEINLSDLTPEDVRDMGTFSSCITSDPRRIKWLYNAKANNYRLKLEKKLAETIRKQEKQYNLNKFKNYKQEQQYKLKIQKFEKEYKLIKQKREQNEKAKPDSKDVSRIPDRRTPLRRLTKQRVISPNSRMSPSRINKGNYRF